VKASLILFFTLLAVSPALAQLPYVLHDEQGRHIIPRGFVINTEDSKGDIFYTPDDYCRMVKTGANFQVVRLGLGRLGGYPGNNLEQGYLLHLDSLVQMGKNAGISTDFKLTVYGTKGFSWGNFWRNENGEYDKLGAAWAQLWERYRDEPAVFGYDLLNEPMRGDLDVSYEKMESAYLIPLYRRLMDVCQKINPQKKILYQPISVPIGPDWNIYLPPFIAMQTPLKRENIIFAPHIYEGVQSRIRKWINRYEKDAAISLAPLFIGEWGPATYDAVDSSISEQHNFIDFYIETVHIFDSIGLGSVKPWFTGTRSTGSKPDWEGWDKEWWKAPYIWSIFKDNQGVGSIERKYIIDILARPYPQCIAGEILEYSVNFPTRSLNMVIHSDNSKGSSKIFIPADRLYPDGFTVTIGELVLIYNPLKNVGLEVINPGTGNPPSEIIWDPFRNQLVVLKWPVDKETFKVTVQPGIYQDILPRYQPRLGKNIVLHVNLMGI
jgi:endoglycosylceramidase